jgi:hypothetical protein
MVRQYIEMANPMYDFISNEVRKSHPNSCILWIEENINDVLLASYEEQKMLIEEMRGKPSEELLLFHGTKEANIDVICNEGFEPKLNVASVYGKGVYFAKNSSYSFNYMDVGRRKISYMFLCNVLIGNQCVGSSGKYIDTEIYDSACDSLERPTIFVTPYKNSSYPRYIIAFYKNA